MTAPDAVVVGAGPNGLAAAVTLARAGLSVEVYERASAVGGGARTEATTLPGFVHDLGSAIHPMAFASPFFQKFGLEAAVEFVTPAVSYAHVLGAEIGLAHHSLELTAEGLGRDGPAWRRLFGPLSHDPDALMDVVGNALLRLPTHPLALARLGLRALEQGTPAWTLRFRDRTAPAMLTGLVAHASGRMPNPARAGAGIVLGALAHARGWPIPVGGSQAISDALAVDLVAHGGRIHLDSEVHELGELPSARAVLLDVAAPVAARLSGDRLSPARRRMLERVRYGAGVFRLDLATSAPIPWRDARVGAAGTVHLGGTRAQIADAERRTNSRHAALPARPFVLLSQPTLFDPSRAPAGMHTVWAYTHVPAGSPVDASEAILATIEAAAPGFRDTIVASHSRNAVQLEFENPNLVGGDISGGVIDLRQTIARPRLVHPSRLASGLYLASSSAAPGPGVNGLSGWIAARGALRREFGLPEPELGPGLQ